MAEQQTTFAYTFSVVETTGLTQLVQDGSTRTEEQRNEIFRLGVTFDKKLDFGFLAELVDLLKRYSADNKDKVKSN